MYERQEFSDYSGDVLESFLRTLTERSPGTVTFTVRFASLPADCAVVEFMSGNGIRFHVPSQFTSAERLNFFTNRWLCTWRMFALVKERYPDVIGSCPLWLDDSPGGSGLAFCGNSVGHVLIPDSIFLETDGYAELRTTLTQHWVPWASRKDKILWRGTSTGDRRLLRVEPWQDIPRFRLCLLAKDFNRDDIFDVGVSNIAQVCDPRELAEIHNADILRNWIDLPEFTHYRYAIDIDGNTCSWPGLLTKLIMGNTVLKVNSIGGYRQWYYDRLVPWKNFVPVSIAMSELLEVAKWLRAHPGEAMEIAARGHELADSLAMDKALDDIAIVIRDCISHWPSPKAPDFTIQSRTIHPTTTTTATVPTMPEIPHAHIVQIETSDGADLVMKVKSAFANAWLGDSNIDPEVLRISGMSGRKYRKFINNLIGSIDGATYLEVGSWMGSTLCSAINRNRVRAFAIDNWSEFGGPKDKFLDNLQTFRTPEADATFVEADFRNVDFATLGKFKVYLFDGPHRYEDHYDGIALARAALEQEFVLIVDDWNWGAVRSGTLRSLTALNMSVLYSLEIRTTLDDTHPKVGHTESDWHNGYFIGVIQQPRG